MTRAGPMPSRRLMMTLLVIAYTLNFVDRQIVGILAEPIKADLGLSDAQLGWMGGTAFALFYTALAIPLAMLADRKDRSWIITAGLTVWSAATMLCGQAQNFWQLFVARMSVGVGEAAGVAPAYSLIADLYPPERRARALAVFSLGIPIGGAAGVLFGGLIAASVDWRTAFVVVGVAGVVFAPFFKWGVHDPGHSAKAPAPPLMTVFRTVAAKPAFWFLSFGAGTASLVSYGFAFWIPSLFARSYGLDLVDRSWLFAAIQLFGGGLGIWLGGILGDRLGHARASGYAIVPAVAFLLTFPMWLIGLSSSSLALAAVFFLIPTALSLTWLGPVVTAVTRLVPDEMRATAAAMFLFINNLIGLGAGSAVIGAISDSLAGRYGDEALRYSAMVTSALYVLAALLMFLASRRLVADSMARPEPESTI